VVGEVRGTHHHRPCECTNFAPTRRISQVCLIDVAVHMCGRSAQVPHSTCMKPPPCNGVHALCTALVAPMRWDRCRASVLCTCLATSTWQPIETHCECGSLCTCRHVLNGPVQPRTLAHPLNQQHLVAATCTPPPPPPPPSPSSRRVNPLTHTETCLVQTLCLALLIPINVLRATPTRANHLHPSCNRGHTRVWPLACSRCSCLRSRRWQAQR
jgi:hypothetical protein